MVASATLCWLRWLRWLQTMTLNLRLCDSSKFAQGHHHPLRLLRARSCQVMFVDADFGATPDSLGTADAANATWVRAPHLMPEGKVQGVRAWCAACSLTVLLIPSRPSHPTHPIPNTQEKCAAYSTTSSPMTSCRSVGRRVGGSVGWFVGA